MNEPDIVSGSFFKKPWRTAQLGVKNLYEKATYLWALIIKIRLSS